jgi:dolichol-phosphate mannosyltransferase
VYGQRRNRVGESWFKLVTARLFYRFLSAVLRINVPNDTGDFRVVTRRVVQAVRQMKERHRFLRGMVPWLGFRARAFLYDRDRRYAGTTKFGLTKMVRFALDAIFSFSNQPLRLATYLGLFLTIGSLFLGLVVVALRLFTTYTVPGISAVLFFVLFIGGLQSFILGICGEYIGRLYEQVKNRPLYVVDYYLNCQPAASDSRPPLP